MDESLLTVLSAEELHYLNEAAKQLALGEVPSEFSARLLELGLVTEQGGMLEITLIGQLRLARSL
jgi:hypothetical protein